MSAEIRGGVWAGAWPVSLRPAGCMKLGSPKGGLVNHRWVIVHSSTGYSIPRANPVACEGKMLKIVKTAYFLRFLHMFFLLPSVKPQSLVPIL